MLKGHLELPCTPPLRLGPLYGKVTLNNLQLKAEGLDLLQLPINVKAGFLGSVQLKVPWSRLGKDPVTVLLDRIFILAEPVKDDFTYQAPETSSWLGSLIATVVGNLKISITNVHIRYEDTLSNVSSPFCMGFMLAKLAAVTVDDNGHETFATSSALECLRKAVQLERLAVYHDTGIKDDVPDSGKVDDARGNNVQRTQPMQYLLHLVHVSMRYLRLGKNKKREPNVPLQTASLNLDDVMPALSEIIEPGIKDDVPDSGKVDDARGNNVQRTQPKQYLLQLVHASMRYLRLGKNKKREPHVPLQTASLNLDDVMPALSEIIEPGIKDDVPDSGKVDDARGNNVQRTQPKQYLLHLVHASMRYLRLGTNKKREPNVPLQTASLNLDDVMLALSEGYWPAVAWGIVDRATGQQQQQQQHVEDEEPGILIQVEWSKIIKLMTYTPNVIVVGGHTKQEASHMPQVAVDNTMQRNSAQILDCSGMEILSGSFVSLILALNFYPKTVHSTVSLQSYELLSPEGTLIQSLHREGREAALTAKLVQHPPDRFFKYLKSGEEASPSLVLETAAAVQSQLEAVRKQAQEQLQLVLQERSRFSLDLDLDALKVTIPVLDSGGDVCSTQLLVDLGHFRLQTEPEGSGQDEDGNSRLYMRFRLEGSDISAFLADGAYDWANPLEMGGMQNAASGASTEDGDSITGRKTPLILPVLDRCSMSVALHQILVEHASLPVTRVGMRVPQLGFHFSPARYRRLMAVVSALSSAADPESSTSSSITEHPQQDVAWKQKADLSSDLSVLTWTGLGNKVAEWQPRWCVLASIYFYVLEHEHSSTYLQYVSLVGKQIVEVPPECIGGSQHVLAITARGSDVSKIHESRQAIILQAKDKDVKDTWLDQLITAVYLTSVLFARAAVAGFEDDQEAESPGGADAQVEESGEQAEQADAGSQQQLFVIGVLDELKLSLSTQTQTAKDHRDAKDLEEVALLELRASTAKVEFEQRLYDLSLAVALRALQIEDLLSGSIAPSCRHMVQSASVLEQSAAASPDDLDGGARHPVPVGDEAEEIDDEDSFADAVEELPGSPDSTSATPKRRVQPRQGVEPKEQQVMVALDAPSFEGAGGLLHLSNAPSKSSNFVIMQLSMLGSKSPDYDNTDMQMFIRMTTLELNCNRPTLVALMEFGAHLTLDNVAQDVDEPGRAEAATVEEPEAGQVAAPDTKNVMAGLLGRGKTCTTFRLLMDMESAHVALNLEDGSQLATLAEENLHPDFRLHPMSMAVNVDFGNLRICDSRLGSDHQWGYMCNIRDPNSSSLVSIKFLSFSKDDDDYKGFEYSLSGSLSAVRIIFLYRFIQELATYFSALATPTAGQVVSVLDPVGGFERLIQQSDMAGQPGLSLDFKLDSPLIVMPQDSNAHDYIQLNVGTMTVSNSTQDLNLLVGVNGKESKPMMQHAAALTVTVRRPLRDLFKLVPSLDVDIQVKRLDLAMSEREYGIVTSCAGANMSETPNLPEDFRADWQLPPSENKSRPAQASIAQAAASQVAVPATASGPATSMRVVVNVMQADLELYLDIDREASLARMQVKGLWVEYRTTTAGEMGFLLTIPTLSVEDMRAGNKPEMRLMMGSMTETDRWPGAAALKQSRDEGNAQSCCPLTMVVMDVRFKPTSQAGVIRIQRPRVLVVLDFLLAVGEFFVPSLGLVGGGRGGSSAADPLTGPNGHIQLTGARHNQQKKLRRSRQTGNLLQMHPMWTAMNTMAKGIRFSCWSILMETSFPGGAHLWASVKLGSNSRYMALKEDNVELLKTASTHPDGAKIDSPLAVNKQGTEASASSITSTEPSSAKSTDQESANFVFDLQAVAPELTFYDGTKWPVSSGIHPDRLLRSRFDLNVTLAMKGTERWMVAHGKGFVIEASSGSSILEPLNVMLEYSLMQGTTTMSLNVSDVAVRLTGPPSQAVVAVSTSFGRVKKPVKYNKIWATAESGDQMCTFWLPVPPRGYAALGCIGQKGQQPPPIKSVCCVREDLLSTATFSDCIAFLPPSSTVGDKGASIWRVENSVGSFLVQANLDPPARVRARDIVASFAGQLVPLAGVTEEDRAPLPTYEPPSLGLVVRDDDSGAVAKPKRFQLRAELRGLRGLEDCCFWFPVAPPGSRSRLRGADNKKPPWRMAYSLAEVGKKKLPDNVNAEIKIGRISCTLLDDLSGLTTPVVDSTVMALNVAADGRPEALNAVAVTSLAASTFNTQLDTWEPLLEPFEGIFKYESNHGGSEAALKAGTQIRIAAKSIVNLNVTAANTESLTNAALGWHKASELEQTDRINIQLGAAKVEQPGNVQAPALDQKEESCIVLDNALGCAMYAQMAADGFSAVVTLAAGEASVLQIPPRRYPGLVTDDLLTSTSSAYLPRHFVAAHVFGAQGETAASSVKLGIMRLGICHFTIAGQAQDVQRAIAEAQQVGIAVHTGATSVQISDSPEGPWTGIRWLQSTGIRIVLCRVGQRGLAVEVHSLSSERLGAGTHARLRSLATLVNNCAVPLEARCWPRALLDEAGPASEAAQSRSTTLMAEEVFENQRYQPVAGWGSSWPGHLRPMDPPRWTSADGSQSSLAGGSRHLYVGVVEPGNSQPLPWDSEAPGSDLCLQLRPHAGPGQPAVHKWGRSVPQHPASKAAAFMLGDLGCTEELVLCEATGGRGRDSFWLSVEAVSSLLHGESGGMMAVEDWRVVAAAPLRVENWLPCRAEYTLWEKPSHSPPASRQRAIAESGATIQCHSIDVRRPILLTWLPQGGWKPEKEAVLISDTTAGDDLPTGFMMTNSASKRQLRVSVEHDIGKSEVSAKVVRLFVPYWLMNDANLPLAYRLVEIKASAAKSEEEGGLGKSLPRSSSASKRGGQRSMPAPLQAHKVLRALESIDDTPPGQPAMLSLAQLDRVGLSVALTSSGVFSSAICFKSFEDQMQRVDMKAVDQHGAFFKLTGWLDMSSLGFERSKVVCIQPHTLLTNRLGRRMHLQQANKGAHAQVLQPGDLAKPFLWPSICEPELLQIHVDDYEWSKPFRTDVEGIMHIYMKSNRSDCTQHLIVRAEVRNGVDSSRFLVVLRRPSSSGPYRIENRTAMLPLKMRQAGPRDSTWLLLQPGSSASFAWEALESSQLLEVLVKGASADSASTFSINDPGDHKPAVTSSGAVAAIHVLVAQELLGFTVACICDWHPGDALEGALALTSSSQEEVSASTRMRQQAEAAADGGSKNQFHIQLHLEDIGLSVVNHTPQELLYVSMQTAIFSYSTGLGSGISRPDFVIKIVVAIQDTGAVDEQSFPYISLQELFACQTDTADAMQLPSEAWLLSIHEPNIWRLHDLMRHLDFSRLTSHEEETTAVAVDPHVRIGLLNLSEGLLKVTSSVAPSQRPRDVLGVYSTLITSLGNTDEMPIRITQRTVENAYVRKSQMLTCALESVRNDLLSQPFQLLSGVDILGNASSTLSHMSKGMAALSMDKQFIRSRQHQESKATVEGLGDGLREGGEALAKGLFRGVTGILTKPLEGAKSRGVVGFVTGVGKGVIGAAAQPASGVLDLLSKTTNGMNASRLRLAAAITYEEELSRRRLPRAIAGDNVLRPYDDYKARGQIILQLAKRGIFGDIDLFRKRGKFAVTDAYEDHFNLPKGHSLMLTDRRVMMLQHPSGMVVAKNADILKKPCTIVWNIAWKDLMTVELVHGKDDPPESPPTRLLLHLRDWSQDTRIFDAKVIVRLVKCHPGTNQAMVVKDAIRQAMQVYGETAY
eukprot:SM000023S07679  [mRNA]  locus=s23:814661:836470:+ [translate_table: standard]